MRRASMVVAAILAVAPLIAGRAAAAPPAPYRLEDALTLALRPD